MTYEKKVDKIIYQKQRYNGLSDLEVLDKIASFILVKKTKNKYIFKFNKIKLIMEQGRYQYQLKIPKFIKLKESDHFVEVVRFLEVIEGQNIFFSKEEYKRLEENINKLEINLASEKSSNDSIRKERNELNSKNWDLQSELRTLKLKSEKLEKENIDFKNNEKKYIDDYIKLENKYNLLLEKSKKNKIDKKEGVKNESKDK